jgi:hypothetical protein
MIRRQYIRVKDPVDHTKNFIIEAVKDKKITKITKRGANVVVTVATAV